MGNYSIQSAVKTYRFRSFKLNARVSKNQKKTEANSSRASNDF